MSDANDAKALGRLGYAQELVRRMGGFSSFAVSFSIISVLTGCITGYGDAFNAGGPGTMGVGWPLVAAGTMLVALAMSELASAFPTAGALYHWSALLGGRGAGWFTAAINITGQIAIVAAIDLGCATQLAPVLGMESKSAPLVLLAVILASHALINALSVKLVAVLNDFSATVHIVGVIVIAGALFAFGRTQPPSFFFASLGHDQLGFANGLVLSMFTFTGYDAAAHLAEETHDPARRTPWGILSSVVISAIFGYLLLGALALADNDGTGGHDALHAMTDGLGRGPGKAAMSLALAAMWFCGLSSVTSASRTVYAFARDGGAPRAFATVDARTKTPLRAIAGVTVIPLLLVLATQLVSSAGLFDVMAKMATMALYVSYGLPIALGAWARRTGKWKRPGPFHLRGWGVRVAWAAALWCVFVLFVCSLPPNVDAAEMLGGVIVVLGLVWFVALRSRFAGPKVDLAELESAN